MTTAMQSDTALAAQAVTEPLLPATTTPTTPTPNPPPPTIGAELAESNAVATHPTAEVAVPAEGIVIDDEKFEVAPHLYRLEGEETLWEGKVQYHALSPWGLFNVLGVGEDIMAVTNKRVFICQARAPAILGLLSCFKARYSSTILRRRDVSTISLHRRVRYPWVLALLSLVWLICATYILSARFVEAVPALQFIDNWYAVGGVGAVFLLLVFLFFTNDWAVTVSHCNRKMVPLTRSAVTVRVNGPADVAQLEEAIRSGYLGRGGYMTDASKHKKDSTKPAFVGRRHLSQLERDTRSRRSNASFNSESTLPGSAPSSPRRRDTGIVPRPGASTLGGNDEDHDSEDDIDEDQLAMVQLHKRLLPDERLLYRCKNTIRVLWCIPVGNNSVAVTNKRLIIKKARYPLFGVVRNIWVSRYFFASIPVGEVRTFQHAYIRLFGRQRFIWSAVLLHVALLFAWLYENEKWCGDGKDQWWRVCDSPSSLGSLVDDIVKNLNNGGTPVAVRTEGTYCVPWLPPLPDLLLELPEIVALALPGVFLLFMLLFNYNRGWGLILDVNEKSQLGIEELRVSLSGPSQMNAIEEACRTREPTEEQSVRPDGYLQKDEQQVGECESGYGKVVVTNKRLLVCRNHTISANRGFLQKWILFWFRDYHVGSFDITDVIACSTRWIPLHSDVAIFASLWVAFWCLFVGSLFRYKACDGRLVTFYCGDLPSLIAQGVGVALFFYFWWALVRHRSPGLVFCVKNVFSFRYHRPDFMRLRMATYAVNQVQEWLKITQERAGCYLPEGEEREIEAATNVNRYEILTIMSGNDVRLTPEAGQTLPQVGETLRVDSDPTQSLWEVVNINRGGGIRLHHAETPDVTARMGAVGDDIGYGVWTVVPPVVVSQEDTARENELSELRTLGNATTDALQRSEGENVALHAKLTASVKEVADLKKALQRQTHDLIVARGEVVQLSQEKVELTYRGEKAEQLVEVREKLLLFSELPAFSDTESPPDTPPQGDEDEFGDTATSAPETPPSSASFNELLGNPLLRGGGGGGAGYPWNGAESPPPGEPP